MNPDLKFLLESFSPNVLLTIFLFLVAIVVALSFLLFNISKKIFLNIKNWIFNRNLSITNGKLSIPGIGDIAFANKALKDEEYLEQITFSKGDIYIALDKIEDRYKKIIDRKNKSVEIFMRYFESLEEILLIKIGEKIVDWLIVKLTIKEDQVFESEHYYYLLGMFENILNRIKIEWRASFLNNGFEGIAEESDYVSEKTAILKTICKNQIQYGFKSNKLLKSEFIAFIDNLEINFREMNLDLFKRARKEIIESNSIINFWKEEIIESKKNLIGEYKT